MRHDLFLQEMHRTPHPHSTHCWPALSYSHLFIGSIFLTLSHQLDSFFLSQHLVCVLCICSIWSLLSDQLVSCSYSELPGLFAETMYNFWAGPAECLLTWPAFGTLFSLPSPYRENLDTHLVKCLHKYFPRGGVLLAETDGKLQCTLLIHRSWLDGTGLNAEENVSFGLERAGHESQHCPCLLVSCWRNYLTFWILCSLFTRRGKLLFCRIIVNINTGLCSAVTPWIVDEQYRKGTKN